MTQGDAVDAALMRRGRALEAATLAWNVIGVVVLAVAALAARSVALAGFGLDSLIEIGASTVVLWELGSVDPRRQRRALLAIGWAFVLLSVYVFVQALAVLITQYHPSHSGLGVGWTALTAVAMFSLAKGKVVTGRAVNSPVLVTEGRVTFIDGLLAVAVLAGLSANAAWGWWWADPAAGLVITYYGLREAWQLLEKPRRRVLWLAQIVVALARDPRLPRPVRWLLIIGLLPIPGPFDEAIAVLALAMIAVFWRSTFRLVLHEHRVPDD